MPTKRDFRLKLSVYIALFALALFSAARLLLFLLYRDTFSGLTGPELASSFLNGLRFDFSVIALFIGPAVLLLNLPVKSAKWVKGWLDFITAELIFLAGFLTADLIYFPKVNRHISEEIIQISQDWGFIVSYAVKDVWWALFPLLALCGALIWFIHRGVNRYYAYGAVSWKKTSGKILVIALCIFLGIRGHLGTSKSLGIADVYNYASTPAAAALTLNGAFTAYQVGRKGAVDIQNNYPANRAVANAQALLIAPGEEILDENYPLMRVSENPEQLKDVNVMIVLLEGWHPRFIDALSHNGYGVTPVFDQIIKDGVNFNNAYAAGLRSIFGFAAVFAGVPLVPGLPMFGYGLEQSAFSPLPKHLSDKGYYTFFAQTSHRDSYRLCALASYLGAQDSYGWEDIPERLKYNQKAPFGYDYDALMFAADKIKNRKQKNFVGMVFTGITHEPFASTLDRFDKYPYDSWENGFKNTLGFADWSIGEFLKRAKEDNWFDNTVFIFVADHTSGAKTDSLYDKFRIPLVIYAPKIFKPRQVDYVVSQLDLVPTIYRLTGLRRAYTALGRDMFDGSYERAALVSEGVNVGLITGEGAIRHSGKQVLDEEKRSPAFDREKAEETLLSLDKAAYTLLKENRWYKDGN